MSGTIVRKGRNSASSFVGRSLSECFNSFSAFRHIPDYACSRLLSALASHIHDLAERWPTGLFRSKIFSRAPYLPSEDQTGPVGRIEDAHSYRFLTSVLQAEDHCRGGVLCYITWLGCSMRRTLYFRILSTFMLDSHTGFDEDSREGSLYSTLSRVRRTRCRPLSA